jgi:hypothetical protein
VISVVLHSKRVADAGADEILEALARAQGEHMAQQADAQVRIFILRPDVASERIAGDEVVHLLYRIIGIRIFGVLGSEIRGHAWEAGALGGKIGESDLPAIALRHLDSGREIFGDGVG